MKAGWLQTRMISKGRAGEKRVSMSQLVGRAWAQVQSRDEYNAVQGARGDRCLPGRTTAARLARAGSSD